MTRIREEEDSHNFTKTSAVTSVITTEQSTVIYNGGVWDYGRMIIDQANAAAESNGRFFNKTNRFYSIRLKRIGESI